VVSLSSTPGGLLSDLLGRKRLIVLEWVIYARNFFSCKLA